MLVPRKQIKFYRDAIANSEPVGFSLQELVGILDMALMLDDAADIIERIVRKVPSRTDAVRHGADWLVKLKDLADPQAPCTVDPHGSPEHASHKDGATPASDDLASVATPGKSTDSHRLPAQPAGDPLSRDERVCAERVMDAAERMVKTFREHLDVCPACAINWQTLRHALGQWESVTK